MKIELPTSWSGVTVGTFQNLYPILKSELGLIDKVMALVSILTDKPVDDIRKIKIDEFKKIAKHLDFLGEFDKLEFVPEHIVIGDKRYSIDCNINNMNSGQYIDFMEVLKECRGEEHLVIQNLHRLMACVILEDDKKLFGWKKGEYNGKDHIEVAKKIKNEVSIKYAYPIALFFYQDYRILMQSIADYGNKQMKQAEEIILETLTDLQQVGDGTSH